MNDYRNHQEFIQSALQQASTIALEYFGKVTSSVKTGDNNQVLTQADLAVGGYLVEQVKRQFPEHNIIDEEAGVINNGSRFTWVIDPIDGTSNFASNSPLYGIFIGLLDGAIPIAGGAALPSFDQIVVASKGQGCFRGDERLCVSSETDLLQALVAYGIDGHQEDPQVTYQETQLLAEIILACRNLRTSNSAFDAVQVVQGSYGASLNRTTKIWDNVAQQILIEEAGGIYTDFFGQPIDYSNPLVKANTNFTMCAANPILHKQVQAIIHA